MRAKREVKYRVGVIGCGRAGTSRARAFDVHPLCKVVAIADTDAENLALGCRRFGVPGYAAYEEMLVRESIDIAMPVLPVRANAGAVVAAAEAGAKAIFCEKPLTARLSEADRMVGSCQQRGVYLASGVMVSSHPDYRRAYELAAGGAIGQVQRINLVRRQWPRGLPRFELGAQVRRQGTSGVGRRLGRGRSPQRLRGTL